MSLLIIEDGTLVAGANCFVSAEDVDKWQSARRSGNWPLPADPVDVNLEDKEAAILKSTDYLNGLAWKGRKAAGGRILAWPRVEVVDGDGYLLDSNVIPEAVKNVSCYLAGLVYDGTDLQPVLERGGHIQTATIGKLSKTYFPTASVRDIAAGVADMLRGLVHGIDAYAGTGTEATGAKVSNIFLVRS